MLLRERIQREGVLLLRVESQRVVLSKIVHNLDTSRCGDVRLQLADKKGFLLLGHGDHLFKDAENDVVSGAERISLNCGGRGIGARGERNGIQQQVFAEESVRVAQED